MEENIERFRKLGISEEILRTLDEMGFEKPTPIQEKSIPSVVEGKDVLAQSATGSGKTLAYGCGIIQNVERGCNVQALVLVPTRELCVQVTHTLKEFSKYKQLNIVDVYGGVSIEPQIKKLRSCEVVIGTPGRILDHIDRRTINLSHVKILVLDEADRMLDMGFIDPIKMILKHCPKERQTLFFSATFDRNINDLTKQFMKTPVKVSVENKVDPRKLHQVYYDVAENQKFSLLVHMLKNEDSKLVMVFCNSRNTTEFVAQNLKRNDIKALSIHGGLTQNNRNNVLGQFNPEDVNVLVCTDVAARGLDIPGISHVYNYNLPKDSKQYVHRIGRTARAGKEGIAINLLSPDEHDNFSRILRENDVKVEKRVMPKTERAIVGPLRFDGDNSRFVGNRAPNSGGHRNGGFGRNGPRRSGGDHRGGSHGRSDGPGPRPRRRD